MPVVLRAAGFALFFFSNEGDPREPAHVHVRRADVDAHASNEAERLVVQHETLILGTWHEHSGDNGAV